MNVIDISGYGHSGKTVVTDFLNEFDNIFVHSKVFEFNLLRVQGGILDLKHNINDNWSIIRSDASLKRFIRITKIIGNKVTIFNLSS